MSDQHPVEPETPTPVPLAPCCQLRHKGMYVYTDGSSHEHDGYDNTIYWCLKTMKSFGPDNDIVDHEGCCDGSRSCYEPI